ncbi:hypothetical protein EYC84_005286 [Monilinia fructicola]|uniref:Acyltransferase 3 domain-containing protein n=1 Tax=Monilinia fructicola TaxID=38448 RepID=A0A5M9JYI2_MONFR|nr:hypothetical protein EYC84_005286 [Monilinia fructicola]
MLRSLRGLVAGFLPNSNEQNYELIHPNGNSSPTSATYTTKDDTLSRLRLSFTRFLFFLLPSPIQRRLQPAHFKPQRLYATSYLDGLRGVASLLVFFCHFTEENIPFMVPSYGLPIDDPVPSSFMQLPFFRVLYSGRPMVHIFFVISGFVLSLKPLKLARAHNYADFSNNFVIIRLSPGNATFLTYDRFYVHGDDIYSYTLGQSTRSRDLFPPVYGLDGCGLDDMLFLGLG